MTSSPAPRRKRDGSLREALIDAGVKLLGERGAAGMSLRECAAMAGVSHAAPAYHFKNLKGLHTAIATRAFRLFCDFMEAERQKAAGDPRAQLLGICEGYFKFALAHRDLFLFMFSGQALDQEDEDFCTVSDRAYEILHECCAPFVDRDTPPEEIEIFIWSLVHGYSHLAMTREKKDDQPRIAWPQLSALLTRVQLQVQRD